ncbi:transcription factor Opi1 [Parasitella parasitica]|nr:transcription factor Opi1 [Parasitella parasitica]
MDNYRQRKNHKASSRSSSPARTIPAPYSTHHPHPTAAGTAAPSTISRWQQLVMGAGSAAGTTAAVISEDSMKCLKYCLSWLKYAIQHIEQQMSVLKSYLVSLATTKSASSTLTVNSNIKNQSVLSGIKRDIVETLRKVVEVITKYAGASLPSQSRQSVRGFILNLPGKWASSNDIRSTTNSPAGSPMLGPRSASTCPFVNDTKQEEAAVKLLEFGQESVNMLNSVSTVFSDTVERAEIWIERLKRVPGMNSSTPTTAGNNDNGMDGIRLPPIRTLDVPNNSFDHNGKYEQR